MLFTCEPFVPFLWVPLFSDKTAQLLSWQESKKAPKLEPSDLTKGERGRKRTQEQKDVLTFGLLL